MNSDKTMNIAFFGFGTVGGGTGDILFTQKKAIQEKHGVDIHIAKIAVKDISETDMKGLSSDLFTENHDDIWNDDSIDVIVELIGGTGIAKTIIEKALEKKIHVVTANKAVIAQFGNELMQKAKENNVSLKFEASVAGSIPIIETIAQHVSIGQVEKIEGIINGTCNYMCSEMEKGGSYKDILADAQQKGFAEADPTADTEGHDAAQKICILSHLCFGIPIPDWNKISCTGISGLTESDFKSAAEKGERIRLIASAEYNNGNPIITVSPQNVPATGKLGSIVGPENIVVMQHEYAHEISLSGPGAGQYPTAVSVVADIIKCGK